MAGKTYKTRDAEVIRRWAAARGGQPAIMPAPEPTDTTAAVPCIRFPAHAYANASSISWEELFDRMRQEGLVFVYQEKTTSGSPSRFCRFVSQEAAREVETGPATHDEHISEATGLYQTEAFDTPLARGIQAFRYPHRATGRS